MDIRKKRIMIGAVSAVVAVALAACIIFWLKKVHDMDCPDGKGCTETQSGIVEKVNTLPPLKEMLQERSIGSGPVTLYIISSFTCSHCANFHKNIFPILKKEYVDTGKIKVIFADFPLEARAFAATMLTRCVPDDKYLGLVDTLFMEQLKWATNPNLEKSLVGYARLSGLTPAETKACLENKGLLEGIGQRRSQLMDTYEIDSTPSFVISKGSRFKVVKDLGSYGQLTKAISEF